MVLPGEVLKRVPGLQADVLLQVRDRVHRGDQLLRPDPGTQAEDHHRQVRDLLPVQDLHLQGLLPAGHRADLPEDLQEDHHVNNYDY